MALAIIAAVLGLLFGSFLNVCISRLPSHESVVRPRSHCPHCKQTIVWYDNVPVLSYILLRGSCRSCGSRISLRYPLVEIAVALAWIASASMYALSLPAIQIAVFTWLLIGLFVMDIETYTLPNAMTIPGVVTGLAFSIAIAPDGGRLGTLARAVLTAAIFCLAFLTARWLYWILRKSEGMGLGDIKMIALLSVFLLFAHTALALFIAIMTAALYSLALLILKKADGGRARIPFGAFLAVGGVASAFFGSEILGWYLGLIR